MISVPLLSNRHAPFIRSALAEIGSECLVVDDCSRRVVSRGMESVGSDACYSSVLTAGQLLCLAEVLRKEGCAGGAFGPKGEGEGAEALDVAAPRLCLNCRSNDLARQIKRSFAAEPLRLGRVLGVSDALSSLPPRAVSRLSKAISLGDVLLQAELALRPYMVGDGVSSLEREMAHWEGVMTDWLEEGGTTPFVSLIEGFDRAIRPFSYSVRAGLPLVGVVGSVGAVFNPGINNGLVRCLEREGCEVALPYLAPLVSRVAASEGGGLFSDCLEECCAAMAETLTCAKFSCPSVSAIKRKGSEVVPEWVDCGMGWALAGQALLFAEGGADGIVYARTFGCLAGHVCGQGVLKRLREIGDGDGLPVAYATIEYDPGTSALNQESRIKLLSSAAREKSLAVPRRKPLTWSASVG